VAEDFRVEVELDDEAHGYSLRERLRALNLDDEAREQLGRNVVVTRDGSRMFAYAPSEDRAREAERVISGLLTEEGLSADVAITRWHPVAEEWRDASLPLPDTAEKEEREYEEREAAERREAAEEGEFDWRVVAELRSRESARDLLRTLSDEDLPVTRRWRYVTVGVLTEERADELAARLRTELPEDTDVRIDVDLSDVEHSPLQFLPF
jgi:hypothetical protein